MYLVLKIISLRWQLPLRIHSSNLLVRFPIALLTISNEITVIFCWIVVFWSWIVQGLVWHLRLEAYTKKIITDRAIWWTCRPWEITKLWDDRIGGNVCKMLTEILCCVSSNLSWNKTFWSWIPSCLGCIK